MKKQIYVVVGHGSCGKSSVIRSLTGLFVRRKNPVKIQLISKELPVKFSVWIRSAQERGKNKEGILDQISGSKMDYILLSIRIESIWGLPGAIDYLEHIATQHNLSRIVILGEPLNPALCKPIIDKWPKITTQHENSRSKPVNVISKEVRDSFNWI